MGLTGYALFRLASCSHGRVPSHGSVSARLPGLLFVTGSRRGEHSRSRRFFTTASGTISDGPPLALLQKTLSYISRVLPSKGQSPEVTTSLEFWEELLVRARDDVSYAPAAAKIEIAVASLDEWSGAADLVTSLLEDPFGGNGLRARWKDRERASSLKIEYRPQTDAPEPANQAVFYSSSSLLRPSVTLLEVPSLKSPDDFLALFRADLSIVCLNPITTHVLDVVRSSMLPLHNPNAFVALNLMAAAQESTSPTRLTSHFPPVKPFGSHRIFFVDPSRALGALEALSANPTDNAAIRKYQSDFTSSGIPSLKELISAALEKPVVRTKLSTALAQVCGALRACQHAILCAEREMESACEFVSTLTSRLEEEKAKTRREILNGAASANQVILSLNTSRKDMKNTMDDLSWWQALWRVDDIGTIVRSALDRAWCKDLEQHLIFHTGRLCILQEALTSTTFKYLSSIPKSSMLYSPVLMNSLDQLVIGPSYPLVPSALTTPIQTRKDQLTTFSTTRLHLAAQSTVFTTVGSLAAGASICWSGWVGWLGSGIDGGSALGVGMLFGLLGVRWSMVRWDKAKERWWQDWERVKSGLDRDLEATLDRILTKQVVAVPEHATDALRQLVDNKKQEVEVIKAELHQLRREWEDNKLDC